jgi:acyl-[acyl-carrier-protein] desaturase
MEHMTAGYDPTEEEEKIHHVGPLMISAYATLQELATRVSHRNTGKVCDDPIAEAMLQRVATDENLHMVFYRNMFSAGFDLVPDQAMEAACAIIEGFQMPGRGMPNWRRNSVIMAKHGIYDLRQHLEEVVMPNVKKWRIFERTDITAVGEQRREKLAVYLEDLQQQVLKFEEQRDRMLAREAAKAERDAEKASANS